jgi:hypothetical protein
MRCGVQEYIIRQCAAKERCTGDPARLCPTGWRLQAQCCKHGDRSATPGLFTGVCSEQNTASYIETSLHTRLRRLCWELPVPGGAFDQATQRLHVTIRAITRSNVNGHARWEGTRMHYLAYRFRHTPVSGHMTWTYTHPILTGIDFDSS